MGLIQLHTVLPYGVKQLDRTLQVTSPGTASWNRDRNTSCVYGDPASGVQRLSASQELVGQFGRGTGCKMKAL